MREGAVRSPSHENAHAVRGLFAKGRQRRERVENEERALELAVLLERSRTVPRPFQHPWLPTWAGKRAESWCQSAITHHLSGDRQSVADLCDQPRSSDCRPESVEIEFVERL